MSFSSSLEALVDCAAGAGLRAFASDIDTRWVQAALATGGAGKLRRRKLPAESVVWLVVGMALFRDHSIADVVRRLDLVMPEPDGRKGRVAPSALPKARARVGERPLRELFRTCARSWAREHADHDRWRGLGVYAMDGTTLRLQDTAENVDEFLLPQTGRGRSGYPQARVVALVAARSHLVLADGAVRG